MKKLYIPKPQHLHERVFPAALARVRRRGQGLRDDRRVVRGREWTEEGGKEDGREERSDGPTDNASVHEC